jgi:uncharacterized protein YqgV (UPF0045/DUF77 family)
MKTTAEITLYPLCEEYRPKIGAFLEKLAEHTGIKRETFPTCTVLTGDHDELMATLSEMMKWSHKTLGRSVFVVKFLPDYEAL